MVERPCGGDVPFFSRQMYGKWYDIAIGTTCIWMKNYKEKFSMGTLVLGPGTSADQISTASTRLRYGALPWVLESTPRPTPPRGALSPRSWDKTWGLLAQAGLRALRRGWIGLKYPMPWVGGFQGSRAMASVPQT